MPCGRLWTVSRLCPGRRIAARRGPAPGGRRSSHRYDENARSMLALGAAAKSGVARAGPARGGRSRADRPTPNAPEAPPATPDRLDRPWPVHLLHLRVDAVPSGARFAHGRRRQIRALSGASIGAPATRSTTGERGSARAELRSRVRRQPDAPVRRHLPHCTAVTRIRQECQPRRSPVGRRANVARPNLGPAAMPRPAPRVA